MVQKLGDYEYEITKVHLPLHDTGICKSYIQSAQEIYAASRDKLYCITSEGKIK
jgi:hypothetical protein